MINHFSQQEENFWPCVSDMFLALFIIALALFSRASDREKNADIRQEQLMADETCRLIKTLAEAFPNDGCINSLKKKTERIHEQHSNGKPCNLGRNCEMNKALIQLPQSASIQSIFGQQPDGIEEFENKKFYHSVAVNYLYKFVIPKEERQDTSDDARLGQAHQEILRRIVKDGEYKIKALTDSKDKDKSELRSMLAKAKADSEHKSERIGQLEKGEKELQAEIGERNQRIAEIGQVIKKKDEQIDELKGKLGEDMRPRIMDKLKKIIDDTGGSGLVDIDREMGVLSIPSGTLVFKNRNKTPNPYKPFANQTSEENLKKIAEALELFMEEDSKEHLVDTITIEGHADPHVRGPLFEYANDEASAWRAPRVCHLLIEKTPPDTLSFPDIFRNSLCLCALQILNIIDLHLCPYIIFLIPVFMCFNSAHRYNFAGIFIPNASRISCKSASSMSTNRYISPGRHSTLHFRSASCILCALNPVLR